MCDDNRTTLNSRQVACTESSLEANALCQMWGTDLRWLRAQSAGVTETCISWMHLYELGRTAPYMAALMNWCVLIHIAFVDYAAGSANGLRWRDRDRDRGRTHRAAASCDHGRYK